MKPVSALRVSLLLATLWLGWLCVPAVASAASCSVVDASNMEFGIVGYPMGPAETTARVTVSCSKPGNSTKQVLVCLFIPPLLETRRTMTRSGAPGEQLAYDIYDNPAHMASGFFPLVFQRELTLTGSAPVEHTFTLYGDLADPQPVPPTPGHYTDRFAATMGYDDAGNNRDCLTAFLGSRDDFELSTRARVVPACEVAAHDLPFPASDLRTSVSGSTQIEIRCAPGVAYKVGLDGGLHGVAGSPATRRMEHVAIPGRFVQYGLYGDAGHSMVWGDIASGNFQQGIGNGFAQATKLDVYGLVPAGQGPLPTGTYSDRVTVTVEY